MKVRPAREKDLESIGNIYRECFPNEESHHEWIMACFRSAPKGKYYVIEIDGKMAGYILWCVKNGFRKSTIVELEQIGVSPSFSGKGVGRYLVSESINKFTLHVNQLGYEIGALLVTTSEGNYAENLYISTLGVERSCTIKNYGSGNETILYRSNINV